MESENLTWFNGPVTHAHLRSSHEVDDALATEIRQFTHEAALQYLSEFSKNPYLRITDTNHAMISFKDLDNLTRPDSEAKDTWREKIINQASEETLKRTTEIRNSSSNKIIIGVEADIIGDKGQLSLNDECLRQIDFTIASFHRFIWTIFSEKEHYSPEYLIKLYLGALDNPRVRVLGHPTRLSSKLLQPLKPGDFLPVIKKMKANGVAYEINILDDLTNKQTDLNFGVIQLCQKHESPLVFGLDFHHLRDIDFLKDLSLQSEIVESNFQASFEKNRQVHFRIFRRLIKNINVLKSLGVKKELVVNNNDQDFDRWLNSRR